MSRIIIFFIICIGINVFANDGFKDMEFDQSNLELMISQEEIQSKIKLIAHQIDQEYANKEIMFVMIMKGSFIFAADLIRDIQTPCTVDFIQCSSYGIRGSKRGELTITGFDKVDISNKHVILVDDIYDSGNTLNTVAEQIKLKNPSSIKTLVLLVKNTPNRILQYPLPDYSLFEIEDKFVVGYGLDFKEYFRNLKGIFYRSDF